MTESRVIEEFLHAGQNRVYPDGIGQYTFSGLPNIEFEVRLFRDLVCFIAGGAINAGVGEDNYNTYQDWILPNYCINLNI